MRVPTWWPLAGCFVLGWLAGWWFTRPDEDWRIWEREVEAHLAQAARYEQQIAALHASKDSALAAVQAAAERSEAEKQRADRERAIRLDAQRRVNEAMVVLQASTTPGDSLRACVVALGARGGEASACERETAGLRASLAQKDTALTEEKRALVLEEEAHALSRQRLWRADSLLQAVPNPQRCPLPFCLTLDATVEPWDRALFLGATVPLGRLFRVGVSRRLSQFK